MCFPSISDLSNCLASNSTLHLFKKKNNCPILTSEKDNLFEIENALIFLWLLFYYNLQMTYPFLGKRYTISKGPQDLSKGPN